MTLNFGDKSSSTYLEIAILKFVVEMCQSELSKRLLRDYRFSDNPATSFETKEEFEEVKADIVQAFTKCNMKLKYVLGRTWGSIPCDNHEDIQPLFGFLWSRSKDEITNNLKLNIKGYKKGIKQGKDLKDMTNQEIDEAVITRAVMLRISGQIYKNLEWLFATVSFSWKILTSMSLEVTSPSELNVDLEEKDPKLVKTIKSMLKELRKVGSINPFKRAWIDMGERLYGFLVAVDGSKVGYAGKVFCMKHSTINGITRIVSTLAQSRSRLSKRNVIANETVARILGNNLLKDILKGIEQQIQGSSIHLINIGDSVASLFSFHEKTKLNNTLMVNASRKFYTSSRELVEECNELYNARLDVGYIETWQNPADAISKYEKNPIDVCNSKLYRFGPELTMEELQNRIIISYRREKQPVFDATKLLQIANQEENVMKRRKESEEKVLVLTRSMKIRESEESEMKGTDCTSIAEKKKRILNPKEIIKRILRTKEDWLNLGYQAEEFVDLGKNLEHLYAKFYTIQSLLTFNWCVSAIKKSLTNCKAKGKMSAIDMFKESLCQMIENSQKKYKPNIEGSEYNEAMRLWIIRPRLTESATKRYFNAAFLMCLNEHDPIKWKVIRYHHLIESEIQFTAHRTQKGTLVNIMRGPLGFFWKTMVKDVKAYIKGCGDCNRMRPMTVACNMGRTMLRDSEMHYGFSHVSLDPLGSIKVSWGRSVREVTPLIIQCLTTKCI